MIFYGELPVKIAESRTGELREVGSWYEVQ